MGSVFRLVAGQNFPQAFNLLCQSPESDKLTILPLNATAHEQTTNERESVPSCNFGVKQVEAMLGEMTFNDTQIHVQDLFGKIGGVHPHI